MKHFLKETIFPIILYFSLEVIMKRINAWRGQAPRGIKTGNTTGTGFGGIVWRVPTILMVLLLGILFIACQEAKPSSKSDSKPTFETTTNANVITAKWQASEEASGYIITVTDDTGAVVFSKTVASETDKKEYELGISLPKGTYTVTVSTKEKPDEAIATSNAIAISTEATPPGGPTIKDSTDVKQDITITWTAPTSKGIAHNGDDATIKGYTIYWKKGATVDEHTNNDGHKPIENTATSTTITVADDKLLGVTQYAIIVVAENTAGLRTASERVLRNTASQAEAPGEPQNVVGTPTRTSIAVSITVTWEAPKTLGKTKEGKEATITGYTVYYKEGADTITDDDITNKNVESATPDPKTPTEVILSGLPILTKYAIVVRAKNSADMYSTSAVITSTTLSLATAPTQTTDLKATQSTVTSPVIVSWKAPTDAGEAANGKDAATLDHYNLYYRKATEAEAVTGAVIEFGATTAQGVVKRENIATTSTDTKFVISDGTSNALDANQGYIFVIESTNSENKTSVLSKVAYIKTLSIATAPSAVSGITTALGTVANNTQPITVEWAIPTTVQQLGKDHKGATATIKSYTLYYKSQYLWNDAENKAQKADGLTITQAEITALKADPNAQTAITTLTILEKDLKKTTGTPQKYTHTFDAMTAYSSYVFVIVARNNGDLDSPIASTIPAAQKATTATASVKPGKIQGGTATKGKADGTDSGNSITLTWTKLTDTGKTHKGEPAEIVQYTIYRQLGDSIPTDLSTILNKDIVTLDKPTEKDATTFTHTFSGLNKKTQYAFAIRATNNVGLESDVSDTANATTDDTPPKLTTLSASGTTVTAVFDATLKAVDSKKFTVTQGSTTYKVNSAAVATNRVNLTLDKTLQIGEEITVAITADAVTSSSDLKNKADSKTAIVIVAVYKPHSSTTHQGKFSLGDYNDPGLFKIVGLPGGSQPQYEITVATASATTPIYTLAKQQITEKVPSSGTDKGIIYVGPKMKGDTWRGIADNSEVTITLTVYDDAGNTEFHSKTVKPKKSPDGSIYSWRGLQNMQDKLDGKNYKLENDIEFPEPDTKGFKKFTPIGSTTTSAFTGMLDGNNKTVSKLYIKHDAQYAGLFGYVKASAKGTVVVKNLTLEDPRVTSTVEYVGALVGWLQTGTVSNVHVQGADGTVESTDGQVGGLVGFVGSNGVVSSSSSSVQVKSSGSQVGGLVGYNSLTGTVTGYATGTVSGKTHVGGLVGFNFGTVTGYATGAVSAINDNVGGLVGQNQGTLTGYATGAVSGGSFLGGLVGTNIGPVTGYALGYVIKKNASGTDVGPGIGRSIGTRTVKVYVGRTETEANAEKTAGAGDHVGVETQKSVAKSNGVAPQGIVIEGKATKASFDGFTFGTAEGEWTLGTGDNWPILNFPSGSPAQNPSIPTKPTNFKE